MKYMTFNSSCSQAGVANLLEDYDINIEDYELAKEMKIGYIFKYDLESDSYIAGPMLQDKKYFDYYLNPKGLELIENRIDKLDFVDFLRSFKRRCMVGLELDTGKHALIFEEYDISKEIYIFMNNKREDSYEKTTLEFNRKELLERLDDEVLFSYISYKKGDYIVDLDEDILNSIETLDRYSREISDYIEDEKPVDSLAMTMDTLFRSFFIDVHTMMDILGQTELRDRIGVLRDNYLSALKLKEPIVLSEHISMRDFNEAIDLYKKIIIENGTDNI